jgi:hypothetical protein
MQTGHRRNHIRNPGPATQARRLAERGLATLLAAVFLALVGGVAGTALAERGPAVADQADLCRSAWRQASRESGVPEAVMQAISLTETGRRRDGRLQPWPWTVNVEGRGAWFDTAEAALAHVEAAQAGGARSFDLGCFQINHRWHGHHFPSVAAMFDPLANARYAARFLSDLHAETGDWGAAAGAYHSRSPEFAARYRTRFEEILTTLAGPAPPPTDNAPLPVPPRENRFPLLREAAGAGGAPGSLVPPTAGAGPLWPRRNGAADDAG